MTTIRTVAAAVTMSLAFAGACTGEIGEPVGEEELEPVDLESLFRAAADEFDVPVEVLEAIGYVETRWQMVEGDEHHGRTPRWGVMALRDGDLAEAAALAGVDEDDLRYDELSNIRGAAALLRAHADALGGGGDELASWADAIAAFSGIDDEEARIAYVHREVYETIRTGAQLVAENGISVVELEAVDVLLEEPSPGVVYAGTSDYPSAQWRPSPNHSARPSGSAGTIDMIIIHTCEGSYAGCWGWLRNPNAGASAHYVVKENGAEITQLVREYRKAWHIAANYSCSRNGGVDCWRNGQGSNGFTVGIEHGGYASQTSFPSGQIEASAKLACNISKDRTVKRDKYHIVGHGKLQPWNRTDPGQNWPWTHYINRVKAHCNDGGGGGGGGGGNALVIDSNNSRNNTAKGYIQVSSGWAASASTPGYWGTGYWWASTQPVSDAAEFRFYMAADGNRTIDAWWTAGSNRSPKAPWVAFDAAGNLLGRKFVDQRTNGNRWNALGTWRFKQGWNKIVLSKWAAEGDVVVADAVRVR